MKVYEMFALALDNIPNVKGTKLLIDLVKESLLELESKIAYAETIEETMELKELHKQLREFQLKVYKMNSNNISNELDEF